MFSPINRTRNFAAFLLFFAVFTAGLFTASASYAQGV